MVDKLKSPMVMLTLIGAVLMVIGALGGWFEVGNELVKDLADTELAEKESAAMVVGFIAALVAVGAAAAGKKMIAIIGVLVGLYGLLLVFNQLPDESETALLDISTNITYWVSLLGAVLVTAGSIGMLIKGVGAKAMKKEVSTGTDA